MNREGRDISSFNHLDQRHGYWQITIGGDVVIKCFYNNDEEYSYEEVNKNFDGELDEKNFYL